MRVSTVARPAILALGLTFVITGCAPTTANSGGSVERLEPVLAFDGQILEDHKAAEFRENSAPLDPDMVEFAENERLSAFEASSRAEELADEYQVGEPLSESDLEFVRAYLVPASAGTERLQEEPVVATALYEEDSLQTELALVNGQSWTFSQSQRSGAGTTAATQGSATINIGFVDHTWTAGWTAKRISGALLTTMVSNLQVQLYGAVAAPPYVGLITNWSRSATATGVQSTYFSRNGSAVGAVAYYNMSGNTVFNTTQGSFQIGY